MRDGTKGELAVLEGPDGVGKSTLAVAVAERLLMTGSAVELLSFPGRSEGTIGAIVYGIHHEPERYGVAQVSDAALQAMHVAAHLDAIERVILPFLERGVHVVLDRYWWSTWVYGLVDGVPTEVLEGLISAEAYLWSARPPRLVALVDRDKPRNRAEEPARWARLRLEYQRLAERERTKGNVALVPNTGTVANAVDAIFAALAAKGFEPVGSEVK